MKRIPSKILSLIPTLASDQDGEVLATTNAITRILKSNNMDWFDIVKVLEPYAFDPAPQIDYAAREVRLQNVIKRLFYGKELEIADVVFVRNMNERMVNKQPISDDQMNILFKLDQKYA